MSKASLSPPDDSKSKSLLERKRPSLKVHQKQQQLQMKLTVKLKNSASCGVTGTMMKVSQTPAQVRNVIKTPLGARS